MFGKLILLPSSTLISVWGLKRGSIIWSLLLATSVFILASLQLPASTRYLLFACNTWLLVSYPLFLSLSVMRLTQQLQRPFEQDFDYRELRLPNFYTDLNQAILTLLRELQRKNQVFQERMTEVAHSCEQLILSANLVSQNVERQSDATRSSATEVTQLQASTAKVTEQMAEVDDAASHASEYAGQGSEQLHQLNQNMALVQQDANHTQQQMQQLQADSQAVSRHTSAIVKVAEQTNLLALNAAIESARAGELGRGFAVVADEVRELATDSKTSAETIVTAINRVNSQSDQVINNMSKVVEHATTCHNKAEQADEMLKQIAQASETVKYKVSQVKVATQEQYQATESLSGHLQQVVEIAKQNAEIAKQTTRVADHLNHLTQQLKEGKV